MRAVGCIAVVVTAVATIAGLPRPLQARQDANRQAAPTFRTGTTLVEIAVVALDGRGRPVVDLKKDEISLTDDGQPREVAFFRFDGGVDRETSVREPLSVGLFSNRPEYVSGAPRHITAIVIDTLHTRTFEQAAVRRQVVKYLDAIEPGTRVAVYELGWRLRVIHDFTDDLASLRGRLERQYSVPDVYAPNRSGTDIALTGLSPEASSMLQTAREEMKRQDSQYTETVDDQQRAAALAGLEELARHIAGFPGRKSVVWITEGFPTRATYNGFISFYEAQIRATMKRLATDGVAVYPVDARGLIPPPSLASVGGAKGGPPPRVLSAPDPAPWTTMDIAAAVTGGRSARNTNDLADGVKSASRDAQASYTIAFYTGEPDAAWHRLSLRTSRRDVHLLTREGYLAARPTREAIDWPDERWGWIASTALGSTVIHMDARVEPVAGQKNTYAALLLLVPEELHFRTTGSTRTADVDIAIAQRRRNGAVVLQKATTALAIPANADTAGTVVRYRDRWTLDPETTSVRLIVRDRATGRYGTLDIPLTRVASKGSTEGKGSR